MTRPIYKEYTLLACPTLIVGVNYDADYFASNVTGATWALTTTEITNGMAHQVSITNDAAVDHSAKTVIITGFYGEFPITETINLPATSATVKTTKYFSKLTSVVPSATIGTDTMDIGISEVSITTLIKNNWRGDNQGICTTVKDSTTAISYTLQFTRSEIEPACYQHPTNCYTGLYDAWNWFNSDDSDLVGATASTSTNIQECPTGLRWLVNSYTATETPTLVIEINQIDER